MECVLTEVMLGGYTNLGEDRMMVFSYGRVAAYKAVTEALP
jgi:hypothetical protein